jgi:hypothetical protein
LNGISSIAIGGLGSLFETTRSALPGEAPQTNKNIKNKNHNYKITNDSKGGLLKLDAVDAVDALHPHLLKLVAVHPVSTKTGCSASST